MDIKAGRIPAARPLAGRACPLACWRADGWWVDLLRRGVAEPSDQRAPDAAGAGTGAGAVTAGAGAGVVSALPGVVDVASLRGDSVSGRVARCAAAGPVGRYSGPRWPQPTTAAALATRTNVLTRIWGAFNMRKL